MSDLDQALRTLVEQGGSIHFVRPKEDDPASQHSILVFYRGKSRSHFTGLQPGNTSASEVIVHLVKTIDELAQKEAP